MSTMLARIFQHIKMMSWGEKKWTSLSLDSVFLTYDHKTFKLTPFTAYFLFSKVPRKNFPVSPYLSTHVTTTRHMVAILIPKFNKSALSISAYPLEAGAVTVNGKVLEWHARKGIQVTHCSLTGQWISVDLTPIPFTRCNISLFALQVLLDGILGNSRSLFGFLPPDVSHQRWENSREPWLRRLPHPGALSPWLPLSCVHAGVYRWIQACARLPCGDGDDVWHWWHV